MVGTIAKVCERGYGFISPAGDESPKQIFFHASSLVGGLTFDGQLLHRRVQFDVQQTPKGERALRVRAAP